MEIVAAFDFGCAQFPFEASGCDLVRACVRGHTSGTSSNDGMHLLAPQANDVIQFV